MADKGRSKVAQSVCLPALVHAIHLHYGMCTNLIKKLCSKFGNFYVENITRNDPHIMVN